MKLNPSTQQTLEIFAIPQEPKNSNENQESLKADADRQDLILYQ